MKFRRMMLPLLAVMLSTLTFGQSDGQKSFEQMKTLAGTWEGHVTTTPSDPEADGKAVQVTLRTTSMGNALLHEMHVDGRPDDPITMFYIDGGQMQLTHYCDAGNRPRMTGKLSPNGKTMDFEFLDVAGSTEHGHMHHEAMIFVDAQHHSEEWTYMLPDGKSIRARMDLQRTK